jgi:hypothetical protein
MGEVQKPGNSWCYTPSSESFRLYMSCIIKCYLKGIRAGCVNWLERLWGEKWRNAMQAHFVVRAVRNCSICIRALVDKFQWQYSTAFLPWLCTRRGAEREDTIRRLKVLICARSFALHYSTCDPLSPRARDRILMSLVVRSKSAPWP